MIQLNPDCIRDLLFESEAKIEPREPLRCSPHRSYQDTRLSDYSWDVIEYHARQCGMQGLIVMKPYVNGGFGVYDITPTGHALIAKMRDDKHWSRVKSKVLAIGTVALPALLEIIAERIS